VSSFQDLETLAEMVGFKYASVSVDTQTRQVTLQCEDYDGSTLTVEAQTIDAAMAEMMEKLNQIVGN